MALSLGAGTISWFDNKELERTLWTYVSQNMKRQEILDYMKRDFPCYPWSIPTLDRRLRYFNIRYIDNTVPISTVTEAVKKEMEGPGKLLGYRNMNLKLRTEHGIRVPRQVVYDVMWDIDPQALYERNLKKKTKKVKQPFVSDGSNWVFSLDGHDKMMGFQNSTFPLAIYGCIDTFSRKIIFLHVWKGNSDPVVVGSFYVHHLLQSEMMPNYLRLDKGTETGIMATVHTYLHSKQGDLNKPTDSVMFGPSTSNKIERWWRDLHERMEKDIKASLIFLLQSGDYDPQSLRDRKIMSYLFIPVLQRECNIFAKLWNAHRIRHQVGIGLPSGVPSHMYAFPEKYGGKEMGIKVSKHDILEVAQLAGIGDSPLDYLALDERCELVTVMPNPERVQCKDLIEAYRFLKNSACS